MTFKVTGAGKLRGACNGDATSLVPFCSTSMPLFSGALVVVVEGTAHGSATLSVTADGLPEATQTITSTETRAENVTVCPKVVQKM